MSIKPIPNGYHSVTPYLITEDATKLIEFIKNGFNGQEISKSITPDGKIMHAEVKIGDSIIMLSDAIGEMGPRSAFLHLYVNDIDSTYKQALQAGAESTMEPSNQFYGDRSAGIKDPCGNEWWIATHVEDVSEEEMKKRQDEYMKQEH